LSTNRHYIHDKFNYQKKFKPAINRNGTRASVTAKKEDLYSKSWDDIRKIVYSRDSHRCVLCGKKGRLHAHHIIPVRVSHDNSLSNLVSVCEKCHRKLEQVGFTILEAGGSRTDVKRAELRMIMESKKKRLDKYNKYLEEQKILKEKEEIERSSREIISYREEPETIDESYIQSVV